MNIAPVLLRTWRMSLHLHQHTPCRPIHQFMKLPMPVSNKASSVNLCMASCDACATICSHCESLLNLAHEMKRASHVSTSMYFPFGVSLALYHFQDLVHGATAQYSADRPRPWNTPILSTQSDVHAGCWGQPKL